MQEKVALDTNIAIDLLNGKSTIIQQLQEVEIIYLPMAVCGELLFGAKNSSRPEENKHLFRQFIGNCVLLNHNLLIAETYAEIRKKLKDKGRPIPENDIWIAAVCVAHDIPLATRDSHFQEVDGLKLFLA